MSFVNGRVHGGFLDELRTPPSEPAGRIYEVDPEAVARMKEIMAKKAMVKRPYAADPKITLKPTRKPRVLKPTPVFIEPEKPVEGNAMTTNELSDELVMELHGRYMAGESLHAMGAETGIAWQALMAEFKQRGLPGRARIAKGAAEPKQPRKKLKKTAVEPVWTAQTEDENYKEWAARQKRAEKPASEPQSDLVTAVEPVAQAEDAAHLQQETPGQAEPANVERLANAVWLVQALRTAGANVEVSGTSTIQVRI